MTEEDIETFDRMMEGAKTSADLIKVYKAVLPHFGRCIAKTGARVKSIEDMVSKTCNGPKWKVFLEEKAKSFPPAIAITIWGLIWFADNWWKVVIAMYCAKALGYDVYIDRLWS